MLKNIPHDFTPMLLKTIMEAGHGEQLLICDANFPYTTANRETVITTVPSIAELLNEILHFFPLDQSVESAAVVMENSKNNEVFESYQKIISEHDETELSCVNRFDFYEQAKNVIAIIYTSDTTSCANIILQKGTVSS